MKLSQGHPTSAKKLDVIVGFFYPSIEKLPGKSQEIYS